MKKLVCAVLFACIVGVCLFAASPGETAYIAVKVSELKEGTGAFDKVLASLPYGHEVYVISVRGKNGKVRTTVNNKQIEGWVAHSSLTTRKVVAGMGKGKVSASANEIALAGKGFNAQVEEKYKQGHARVDYASVDKLEDFTVSKSSVKQFIKDGALNGADE